MAGYEVKRSGPELRELIRLAKALGFYDDVAHWQGELDKLEAGK